MILMVDDDTAEIRTILREGLLFPVFQPIADFRIKGCLGFEALIRGPEHSALHMPGALFAAAAAEGVQRELEHAAREAALRAFVRLGLPGRLFLNVSPGVLMSDEWMNGQMTSLMHELGLAENRVVIELTENEQIAQVPDLLEGLQLLRGRGYQIAIDDLGEGFANLRMWSEVRPEYVKIDRHFVHGIASDRIKYHFVRAMEDLAEICNAALIAEGIESVEDFECVRDMGIACGQGYFIARPAAVPTPTLREDLVRRLGRHRVPVVPLATQSVRTGTARDLVRALPPIPAEASNDYVVARFEADASIDVLPVVSGELPIGMINRHNLLDRFSRPFHRELYGRRTCQQFMDPAPLIVDQRATIQELAMMLAQAPKHYLFDGYIVTGEGRYLGVGSGHDLMATITEMQISAARYANPLTQLPGNVPINEHIDRMLTAGASFVAAYIDIDNFKPFNDNFGYRRGDDVILMLGQLIRDEVDERKDFIGHIGGDDFFVVFQSDDWELRCWEIVRRFSTLVAEMSCLDESCSGGYMAENRRGEFVYHALPALSVGAVSVRPGEFESHREVAAAASEAKKQAKKSAKHQQETLPHGQVFIERRRPGGGVLAIPGRVVS